MTTSTRTLGSLTQSPAFEFAFRVQQPLPVKPKACVVLLHGVGGSETNLADLAAAMGPETLVVLPRGPLQFAPGQFGWFRVNFTASGPSIVEAEAEQSRQALIRFVGQLQAAYGMASSTTVMAGFSQGGILSAKALMKEGGVIACEAPRHPWPDMHPEVRKGLIEAAQRLNPLVFRWGK